MVFKLIGSFLLIAVLAVDQCYAIPRYLQTPTAVEIADGQTALFICHALDAQAVYWEINKFGQNHQESKDLGVDVVTDDDYRNSSIKYSNLTIPASSMADGARVVCFLFGRSENPSEPAPTVLLRVQGTYEPVRDITLTNISYSVTVGWSPPPYLPSLPPTGYNITIINTTTEEAISQATVSVTNYTFQLEPDHLCSILRIRVVAFSQLLGGHTADHVWSLGGAVEPNSIMERLRYIERDNLQLSVRFKVAGFCLDQLENIILETTCDNTTLVNTTDASSIDTRGVVSGPHELSIQELPEDSSCSYQVVLTTVTNRTTPSQSMLYDTFDLASVQFSAQVANVCVECCFINGSTAQGCHAEQQNFRSVVVGSFNAARVDGSLTTGTQCFESNPGEYAMVVYDINSDSTLSDDPYTSSLVIVPSPTLPTSTVVPTTSPTTPGTPSITAIVGGTVGGSVLFLLIVIIIMLIITVVLKNNKKVATVLKRIIATDSEDDLIIQTLEIKTCPGSYYICALKKEFLDSQPTLPIVGTRYEILVEPLDCAVATEKTTAF